jgi:aspartate aminotransferase
MKNSQHIARRVGAVGETMAPVLRFIQSYYENAARPGISDFAVGNPQEMPLPRFVEALQQWAQPQNKDWFGYKMSEDSSRQTVVESLRSWRGVNFEPDDIFMTNGGFSAIYISLLTLVDPGDEVIFITPPWFFYESMIVAAGGRAVRVKIDERSFDLDLDAIAAAITERTRAIIINSPSNPTGKIYPPQTLQQLASILTEASERCGQPIYLLSDEAYSRIVYDGRDYPSPTNFYPYSLLLYTYGKTLLTPGQRIGYIALPPTMPDRLALRDALLSMLVVNGWAFPNALLQHALPDLEKLSIDIEHLQAKRDRMVEALDSMGYQVHVPDGTFYLMPRSPLADDWAFSHILADCNILCLPGTVVELPGYFRLSLTASDAMIDAALPNFEQALRMAKTH